jgi:hypothetical protein
MWLSSWIVNVTIRVLLCPRLCRGLEFLHFRVNLFYVRVKVSGKLVPGKRSVYP